MLRFTRYLSCRSTRAHHFIWARHALLVAALLPMALHAEVIINGTRVIYPGNKREMALQLNNVGEAPALVQSWIDNGNPNAQPEEEDVPFVILPPVVRIDPKQGQTLRILFSGTPLPQDRDSLYWFNALEIPPQPEGDQSGNYLQFAVRSRIKLFYRPEGLPMEQNHAAERLQWHHQGQSLMIRNPSPYFITLASVTLDHTTVTDLAGKMIAPFDTLESRLPATLATHNALNGSFSDINDFGASSEHPLQIANQ